MKENAKPKNVFLSLRVDQDLNVSGFEDATGNPIVMSNAHRMNFGTVRGFVIGKTFNRINGIGEDMIIAVEHKNETGQDISILHRARLKRPTGHDMTFQTLTERDMIGFTGQDRIHSVTYCYLTGISVRNPAGHPSR